MQVWAPETKRMLQALLRARAKPVDRQTEPCNTHLAHGMSSRRETDSQNYQTDAMA